jgi:hypothetical protein
MYGDMFSFYFIENNLIGVGASFVTNEIGTKMTNGFIENEIGTF